MKLLLAFIFCLFSFLSVEIKAASQRGGNPKNLDGNVDPAQCKPLKRKCSLPIGADISIALDDFRSLPEGSWEGNMGAFASLNFKAYLPKSFLLQLAGSYGLYDWAGRTSAPFKNTNEFQQQGFVTGAVSRETPCNSGVSFGLTYDWMFNKNFGVFSVNPFLSQVRGQLGFLIKKSNEIGAWATINTNSSNKESQQVPLKFRAISQANLFWCYYFKNNSYTMLWAGSPYRRGLMYTSGRAGRYIFGARFRALLTSSLSVFGHGAYMGARSAPDGIESKNYAANVCFGLTYSFGCRRAQQSPYMTMADNSNFLVDTNVNL